MDDYLREVRPLFLAPRTFQRTVYRPGEICQFDLWQPSREVPVGHGQTRRARSWLRAWAIRGSARARWCSRKEAEDLLWGIARCLWSLGALARRRWSGIARALCTPAAAARPMLCRVLRAAEDRLAFLRGARPAGEGRGREAPAVSRDELRAGPDSSLTRSTSSCSSTRGSRRPTAGRTAVLRAGRSTGSPRSSR